MNLSHLLTIEQIYIVAGIIIMLSAWRFRRLHKQLSEAQLKASRLARQLQRAEMVLRELAPDIADQVKARSDMEWQQATARLKEGTLPEFFPLEPAFVPISPLQGGQSH